MAGDADIGRVRCQRMFCSDICNNNTLDFFKDNLFTKMFCCINFQLRFLQVWLVLFATTIAFLLAASIDESVVKRFEQVRSQYLVQVTLTPPGLVAYFDNGCQISHS